MGYTVPSTVGATDHRQNNRAASISASTPTPERTIESSPRLSSSPAPVLPARVTALRDPASQRKSRTSTSSRESPRQAAPPKPAKEELVSEYDDPSILLPRKRKRPSNSQPKLYTQTTLSFVKIESKSMPIDSEISLEPQNVTAPNAQSDGDPPLSTLSRSPSLSVEPFQPPSTVSGLPCLIEAAARREAAIEEAEAARAKVEARMIASQGGEKVSRIRAREKTRTSGRLGTVLPFGLPFPPVLEWKSEVSVPFTSLLLLTTVHHHGRRGLLEHYRRTRSYGRSRKAGKYGDSDECGG